MLKEGTWVDYKDWRVWIYEGHKMTRNEQLQEASKIYNSGYLQIQEEFKNLTKRK
jgi:hypothetical protein